MSFCTDESGSLSTRLSAAGNPCDFYYGKRHKKTRAAATKTIVGVISATRNCKRIFRMMMEQIECQKGESNGEKRQARLPHVILQPDYGEKPEENDGRDSADRSSFRKSTAFGAEISWGVATEACRRERFPSPWVFPDFTNHYPRLCP